MRQSTCVFGGRSAGNRNVRVNREGSGQVFGQRCLKKTCWLAEKWRKLNQTPAYSQNVRGVCAGSLPTPCVLRRPIFDFVFYPLFFHFRLPHTQQAIAFTHPAIFENFKQRGAIFSRKERDFRPRAARYLMRQRWWAGGYSVLSSSGRITMPTRSISPCGSSARTYRAMGPKTQQSPICGVFG